MADFVAMLGSALLHFLWQGALVGVVAALLLQVLRDARPQARYAVACLALLACLLLPVATLLLPLIAASMAPAMAALPATAADEGFFHSARTIVTTTLAPQSAFAAWSPWIVAAWAAGCCAMSVRMALGLAWIRNLPRADDRLQHTVWQARLDVMAAHFALPRAVELRLVHGIDSPAVAGWWRPVVLLPIALLSRMPADLVEALLAHELAHVRRHDYLVNLLQNAVEALLFYHPVTWWLSHRIRVERELIADQLAAEVACAPRKLAVALSELSDFQRDEPVALHLLPAARGGHLMSRIQRLVRPAGRAHPAARVLFPLLGLVAAGMATYSFAAIDDRADAPDTIAYVEPASAVDAAAPADDIGPAGTVVTVQPSTAKDDPDDERGFTHDGGPIYVNSDKDKRHRDLYALVSKHGDDINTKGSIDMRSIRLIEGLDDGEFLWFRRDGRDYLISDPAVLARAAEAWRETDALGRQMEPLSREMERHGERMEALGERMEALSENMQPTAEFKRASRRMEELGEQQNELGDQQSELGERMGEADSDAERDALAAKMDALSKKMDALSEQMDREARIMDAESERMDKQREPMDALSREMDEASKPMDALGKKMDVIGRKMDFEARKAEAEVRLLIDEAMARKLHEPVARR